MSALQSPAHGHGAAPHVALKDYATGFVLSVVLTAIPFWLVMSGVLGDKSLTAMIVAIFAGVQVIVQMVFFLHMNTKSEGGWNFLALAFTIILVGIVMSGSLWVMYHLNQNMMPMSHAMADQP
jgi:cytochrome o ubiquinol oxidase operon protein cyoD